MKALASLFLYDAKPFSDRREIKWDLIKRVAVISVCLIVVGLLLTPDKKEQNGTFHENIQNGAMNRPKRQENDPTDETARQLNQGRGNMGSVHANLDYLYQSSSGTGRTGGAAQNKNAAMILSREGLDARGSLPAGSRIEIRLINRVVISNQTMPVIGVITADVVSENDIAITKGAKVLGSATFDDTNERAVIEWKTVILSDGRERPFQAIGVSSNGQAGIEGNVKSDAVKNTMGATLLQFIGSYADGSMSHGSNGVSEGGTENGLKNAVSQTAKERASGLAENMKKEKKWIEINAGTETLAVLSQSFAFKDPGAVYGR